MNIEEIKLRQLYGQHLIMPADRFTVLHDLCGLQAQFMSNAMHSLKIRCNDLDKVSAGHGLVKNWTLRGTMHIFAEDDLPLFIQCEDKYRLNQWDIPSFWNQRECWALTPDRQKYYSQIILDSLKERALTRDELKDICRGEGMTEPEEGSMFDPWGGGIRELCERGFIHYLICDEKLFTLTPRVEPLDRETAQLELARRYFTYMAPATIHDAMYFFRVPSKQVKSWLNELPVTSVECCGKTFYYIENGTGFSGEMPRCVFLAGFDQLMLGYEKKESLYLAPEHLRGIFNLSGIVMPSLMLDGRIVGRWKRKTNKLTVELFMSIGRDDATAIRNKAEMLWEDLSHIDITEI